MGQTRNLDVALEHSQMTKMDSERLIDETRVQPRFSAERTKGLELDPFSRPAKRNQKFEQNGNEGSSRDAQWRAFRSARGDLEVRWLLRHRSRC